MKSLLSFVIAITMLCLLGCSSDEPKGLNDIALSTDACVTCNASDIKTTSAMLNGNINYDAISGDRLGVMKYGFIISTNNEPTAENGQVLYASNISSNVYSICAKNLAPEEQYYYVSFFYDGTKYYYGKVLSFVTSKFESLQLKSEANAKETSVDLKCIIDYKELGYLDNYNAGVDIGEAKSYIMNISGRGENYTAELTISNISAASKYEYYFFIEYKDINGKMQTLKGEIGCFYTEFELSTGAVDLGLSVLWSSVNLGADSPEEVGSYFAWGEVDPKNEFSSSNYLYNNEIIGIDITDNGWLGQSRFYSIVGTEYDAANVNWGNGWKIPSKEQCDELANNCKWESIQYKGCKGFLITGDNGERIFLPECGYYNENKYTIDNAYYWAGECQTDKYSDSGKLGKALSASLSIVGLMKGTNQVFDAYYGLCVRPVKEK